MIGVEYPIELPCRAVVSDHDDTVIVSRRTEYPRMQHVGQILGRPITRRQLDASWGKGMGDQCALLYGEANREKAQEIHRELAGQYPRIAQLGCLDILADMEAHDMKLGIVSAHNAVSIRAELVEIGINPAAFLFIHGDKETSPYHKDDPRTFNPAIQILAEHGISPEETVYIGDDIRDLSALAVGWGAIGVTTGVHSYGDFQAAGREYSGVERVPVVRSLADIRVETGKLIVPPFVELAV